MQAWRDAGSGRAEHLFEMLGDNDPQIHEAKCERKDTLECDPGRRLDCQHKPRDKRHHRLKNRHQD